MKYIVQYTVPYVQRLTVGIEADSSEEAIEMTRAWSETGDTIQDGKVVSLLHDEYEAEDSLEGFTIEQELADDAPWPEFDEGVNSSHQHESAFQVGKLLIDVYRRGEMRGGSIDWDELDQAYQAALKAASHQKVPARTKAGNRCLRLAVVLEGGIVQSVIADQPEAAPAVAIIDYDVDGQEPEALSLITQSDGSQSKAYIVEPWIEPTRINLDEVFQPIDP